MVPGAPGRRYYRIVYNTAGFSLLYIIYLPTGSPWILQGAYIPHYSSTGGSFEPIHLDGWFALLLVCLVVRGVVIVIARCGAGWQVGG